MGELKAGVAAEPYNVLDICQGRLSDILKEMMEKHFLVKDEVGRRLLPPALLSDTRGLRIWREITRLPDYYQTREEIQLLETHSKAIADQIVEGSILIDLGCGDIRKITPLLDTLEASQKSVYYFALDLSKEVLDECLQQLNPKYRFVHCTGLWGTFADALLWHPPNAGPKLFLSLGSIYGNDRFEGIVTEFRKWSNTLQKHDRLLIGVDAKNDAAQVWNSYHDDHGVFERFMRNALEHSNSVLGHQWYKPTDWEILGRMDIKDPVRHCFVFRALTTVKCELDTLDFAKGDEIVCYEVFKNSPDILRRAFQQAGLKELGIWTAASGTFRNLFIFPDF